LFRISKIKGKYTNTYLLGGSEAGQLLGALQAAHKEVWTWLAITSFIVFYKLRGATGLVVRIVWYWISNKSMIKYCRINM